MTENNNSSEKDTDGGDVMADIMKVTERQAVECLWKRVKMPLSILVLSGTGKTVYSKENPEESASAPTEFNTIDDLRQAIHQNNYTIEYQLLGFEPLPKSEPIYKNPEDRPKPPWIERFLSPILYIPYH